MDNTSDGRDGGSPVLRGLSRRQLLRGGLAVGGGAALAAVLAACGPSAPQASTATAAPGGGGATPNASSGTPAAAAAAGTPKRGGTLRYGLSTDPSNFEPHISSGAASGNVKLMVYSNLLTYDPQGQLIGDLAESFGWADSNTYEVTLRKGVQFHDGSTLTPDDVAYTYQRIMNPSTAATNASRLADVSSIEAGDNNVVRFRMKQPNATLPYTLADNSSLIVSKKWMESGVDPKSTMMGTGPFSFVDRQPGVAVNVKRNPNYFLTDMPYLDAITFQPMADDDSRVTALRSGSVDFIDYVPYTQMDVIQKSSDLVFKSDKVLGFGWLAFVADKQPVQDVRVRQAFAYGMDRDKLAQTAFNGHGLAMTGGLIPEGWVGYSPDLQGTYNVDYEKSKSLLQQAGVSPLNIDILTTSTYSVIARPAEAAQAELKQANINGNLVEQEWLTFRQTVQDGTYAVHVWGTAPGFNDPDFLSDYVGSNGFFAKQIHFRDDQIDQLLAQGRQTVDPAKRNQIYHDVEKRVLDVLPWTYLIRREQGEAMQQYVQGYSHIAAGAWTQITLRQTWLNK